MRIEILVFAALRDALGPRRLAVDLPEGAVAADLIPRLVESRPRARDLIRSCRLARGTEFLAPDEPLADGDEVALIPPVSGGRDEEDADAGPPPVLLTGDPLDGEGLARAIRRRAAGALVVFEGTVRSPSRGREVRYLEYEAHEEMAAAQMTRILEEVAARWPGTAAVLHHRTGRVGVGETSVVAAVSAPHRDQAFAAGRHLIERLKADVPIWKKEVFTDGSEWVGTPGSGDHGEAGEG